MLSKRDNVYYDWRFDNKEPKNTLWLLYCKIRKSITIYESQSKVMIWGWKGFISQMDEALKRKEVNMDFQERVDKYIKEHCKNCKNKNTDLCEIRFSRMDDVAKCQFYKKEQN